MKKISLAITLILMLFCSCQFKSKHIKELYANGSVKCEYDTIVGGLKDGLNIKYDSLGYVICKSNFKNGKLNGSYTEYYHNGQIRCIGSFLLDKQIGWFIWYDNLGKIIRKEEYMLINPRIDALSLTTRGLSKLFNRSDTTSLNEKMNYLNQVYSYKKGKIDLDSSYFYSIICNNKIKLGDTLKFKIILVSSTFKELGVYQAGLRIDDSNNNKINYDREFPKKNHKYPALFFVSFVPNKKGDGFIFGLIEQKNEKNKIWDYFFRMKYFVE